MASSRWRWASPVVAALAAGCGSYEVAHFSPAEGAGSVVTNGSRLGVAHKLMAEGAEGPDVKVPAGGGGQCFLVVAVEQAYTARGEGPARITVVQVAADLVNGTSSPAAFRAKDARLEVAGRSFAPKWTYLASGSGAVGSAGAGPRSRQDVVDEVPPGVHARYDLFFELDPYAPAGYPGYGAPPASGGIPLSSLTEVSLSWKAEWAGRERAGATRFRRGSGYGPGFATGCAVGPAWGFGWYFWPHPWPVGLYVRSRPYFHTHGVFTLRAPLSIRLKK